MLRKSIGVVFKKQRNCRTDTVKTLLSSVVPVGFHGRHNLNKQETLLSPVTSRPTLSVFMSCYNHGHYVGDALEAILSQSYRPLEVVVTDDGSTDNSLEVILKFSKRDPVIRVVRNEKNQGVVYSQSKSLNLARGDYVYGASADDKVLPGFFEKSMGLLAQYPHAALCCSDPAYFDASGLLKTRAFRLSPKPTYLSPKTMVDVIRKENFIVGGHTSILKRETLKEAGDFIENLRWHCDWFAYHVIAFRYGLCYIPEFLASQRDTPGSYSSGRHNRKEQRQVIENILNLLLQPQNKDMHSAFVESGILSSFGIEVFKLILTDPRFIGFRNFPFLLNTLKHTLKQGVGRISPQFIRTAYRRWRDSEHPFILKRKYY